MISNALPVPILTHINGAAILAANGAQANRFKINLYWPGLAGMRKTKAAKRIE